MFYWHLVLLEDTLQRTSCMCLLPVVNINAIRQFHRKYTMSMYKYSQSNAKILFFFSDLCRLNPCTVGTCNNISSWITKVNEISRLQYQEMLSHGYGLNQTLDTHISVHSLNEKKSLYFTFDSTVTTKLLTFRRMHCYSHNISSRQDNPAQH